jgi:hypothetical protein
MIYPSNTDFWIYAHREGGTSSKDSTVPVPETENATTVHPQCIDPDTYLHEHFLIGLEFLQICSCVHGYQSVYKYFV